MYDKASIIAKAEALSEQIKALETVQEYQKVEAQIHRNHHIDAWMADLKQRQKQSVNLQNYGKLEAYKRSEAEIAEIEQKINALPIVTEFRDAQADANELLQMMINTMADQLNAAHHKQ
ncbi:RicAFT regulatory complex protein RicA family protein [Staphylococcus simulans]|uniref:RicAFT regulatory complex protein RicA family protein n=1 Tax=Staphylococcus simulans TaxID=1286 RepID=UPI00399B0E8B